MAQGNVGSVSITVLPDLTKFRRHLREYLKAQEKYYKHNPVEIFAVPELEDKKFLEQVGRTKAKAEHIFDDLNINVKTRVSQGELKRTAEYTKASLQKLMRDVKVSVKTRADLKEVEANLKKVRQYCTERLNNLHANIHTQADLETVKQTRQRIKQYLDKLELSAKLDPKVSDEKLAHLAHHIQRKIERELDEVEVTVNADTDTGLARAKLAWLTRPRKVHIGTVFEDTGQVAQALAAFSGFRILDKTADALRNIVLNIDTLALKAHTIYGFFGGVGAVASTAAAGVINFGGGLAKALKISILLPGALSGLTAAGTAYFLSLKDAGKVLKDLKKRFARLQDQMSASFWRQAEKPIRRLADNVIPLLSKQMTALSKSAGNVTAQMANTLNTAKNLDRLRVVFHNTQIAVNKSAKGMSDFVSSMGILSAMGSEYLPRLSDGFNKLNARFLSFLKRSEADGSLRKWADDGILGFKTMSGIIRDVTVTIRALYETTNTAGTGMLGLARNTRAFADMVSKPLFKNRLTTIFEGARIGATGLKDGLTELGRALGAISPLISNYLATAGTQTGRLVASIGRLFQSPQLNQGLENFRQGFINLTNSISATLYTLRPTIGAFLSALANVATTIGQIFGGTLQAIAPTLTAFLNIISSLPTPLLGTIAAFLAFRKGLLSIPGATKTVENAMQTMTTAMNEALLNTPNITQFDGKIGKLRLTFTGLKTVIQTAGTALKTAFISNAPLLALSAITTAIGYFASKSGEASQRQEDLKASLDQTTGALTTATAKFYATDKEVQDFANNYRKLGGNIKDVYSALAGNEDAIKRVKGTLGEFNELSGQTTTVIDGTTYALNSYASGNKHLADTFDGLLGKQKEAQEEVRNSAEAQRGIESSINQANEAFNQQVRSIDEVINAQKRLVGEANSITDAQARHQRALEGIAKAAKDGKSAFDASIGAFTGYSEAGRAAADSAKDLGQSMLDVAVNMRKQGESSEAVKAKLQAMYDEWARHASVVAGSAENLAVYAKRAGLIPKDITTQVFADTKQAYAKINDFIAEVDKTRPGIVKINGTAVSAEKTLGELVGHINTANGTVTINGQDVPANTTLIEFINKVNKSQGTATLNADSLMAREALESTLNEIRTSTGVLKMNADPHDATLTLNQFLAKANKSYATSRLWLDTSQARAQLDAFIAHGTRGSNKVFGGSRRPVPMADGGIIRFFANGSENHVAQIARPGAMRVWAEPETGGEAYIPLAQHKRKRSTQILQQVSDKFGYRLQPDNTPTGGNVYNVSVNVSASELRDVVSVADFIEKLGYKTRMGVS